MSLICVGSIAYDAIETPFGKRDKIVGGAAVYAAYAASNFIKPIQLVSIIGNDFEESEIKSLESKGATFEGVERVKNKKSFFWSGRYHMDMNTRDTLVTDLNVLGDFNPVIPNSYQQAEFLMLGNLHPQTQISVIGQMKNRPRLIALDTMNYWISSALEDLKEVFKLVDVLMINDEEARQLSGDYSLVKAARKIMGMGPKFLVIKKGEHGALLFHQNEVFFAPALPLEDVFDPTGAGDTFSGGFMGHLAHTRDISFNNLKTAIIVGSAMASFCVEKFGPERLKEITKNEIDDRIQQFIDLVHFDISLV
jgi:sugar/nucleoside kinase (ribokinase family)